MMIIRYIRTIMSYFGFIGFCLLQLTLGLHLRYHNTLETYVSSFWNSQQILMNRINTLISSIEKGDLQIHNEASKNRRIDLLENLVIFQKQKYAEMVFLAAPNLNQTQQWQCKQIPLQTKNSILTYSSLIETNMNQIKQYMRNLKQVQLKNIEKYANSTRMTNQLMTDILNTPSSKKPIIGHQPQPIITSNLNAEKWLMGKWSLRLLQEQYTGKNGSQIKMCQLGNPFYNGSMCIKCPQALSYFRLDTLQCVACQYFNATKHVCKDPPKYDSTNIAIGASQIVVPKGTKLSQYYNEKAQVCPQSLPFYDGTKCIICESLFNITSKKCTKCKQYQFFNINTHNCDKKIQLITNFDIMKNMIVPQNYTIEGYKSKVREEYKQYTIQECNINIPYYNGTNCISCEQTLLFNLEQQKCMKCQNELKFNPKSFHCQKILRYSKIDTFNWIAKNPDNTIKILKNASENQNALPCNDSMPYFNGTECIDCNGLVFNFDTNSCVNCPQNTTLNLNIHKCMYAQPNYQTNPSKAINLIYANKSINYWKKIYYQNLVQNSQIRDCPPQRMYYDGINCIVCSDFKPYFNMESKLCQDCKKQGYDSQKKQCINANTKQQ